MHWWQALILGVVEGVTEYLPVSSTGHLILAERAMGLTGNPANDAFAICIQGGAILAVVGLYWSRFKQMGRGLMGRDPDGKALFLNICAAFAVTAALALPLESKIKENLFAVKYVVIAWLVGGLLILLVAWSKRGQSRIGFGLDTLGWKQAAIIGFAQAIAMWPGTSRSLVTIAAGVLLGMSLAAAVEFAFLLGVVTLLAATAHDSLKHGGELMRDVGPMNILLGLAAAAVSAWLAIEWMVSYLRKHGLAVFGYYRVAIAVVVGLLLIYKVLPNEISG